MKIICLMEDTCGNKECISEHGLSFFVKTEKDTLLLDFGASDSTIENARKLGVDLEKVEYSVLSHGHYDHSGSIISFSDINKKAPIYVHENAFGEFYHVGSNNRYIGIDKEIRNISNIKIVNSFEKINERIDIFSGVTGRKYFAKGNKKLMKKTTGGFVEDDFSHEQYTVVREGEQSVLFSGCAHNGIINILEKYFEIYHSYPTAVVSGFHLIQKNGYSDEDIENIKEIAEKLCEYPIDYFTGHCTGEEPIRIMKEIMGEKLDIISCGNEINL